MESKIKTLTGPAWAGVRYFTTTLAAGESQGDWAGLNLGQHCGDLESNVIINRRLLNTLLPSSPHWLQQVHSTQLYQALRPAQHTAELAYSQAAVADAAWTTAPNTVLAILTADCLPVVIANTAGTVVGVAHAGWRGLAAGVLEKLFLRLQQQVGVDADWRAWIGPAISQTHFEVGADVFNAFVSKDPRLKKYFFSTAVPNKYLANLAGLAANRLYCVAQKKIIINLSDACTYKEKNRYYSYRRHATTGRVATVAWLV